MGMEVKINGVQAITSLDEIKFDSLKKGDQILQIIINEDRASEINYSDFDLFFVNQIKMNVLSLTKNSIKHNVFVEDVEYDEDENEEQNKKSGPAIYCDYDHEESEIQFLKVGDKYLDVRFHESETPEGEICADDYATDREIKFLLKKINGVIYNDKYYIEKDYEKNSLIYYYINELDKDKGTYYCYIREDKFKEGNEYSWSTGSSQYIINPNEDITYQIQKIDILKLVEALKEKNPYSYDFKDFKRLIEVSNYEIADYLKDKSILKKIIDCYSNMYFIDSDYIKKFFEPIYSTDGFTSYFTRMYNNDGPVFIGDIHYEYKSDYSEDVAKEMTINKRISQSIYEYLLKSSLVNPYTGKVIEKEDKKINSSTTLEYEDSDHIIVKDVSRDYVNHVYFYKHKGIFVKATKAETKEIDNTRETFKILSEG